MWKRMFVAVPLWMLLAATLWAANNPFGDGDSNDSEAELVRQREALQKKCDALLPQKEKWRASWMDEGTKENDLSKLTVELSKSTAMPRNMLKKYLNDRAGADKSYATGRSCKTSFSGWRLEWRWRAEGVKTVFPEALRLTFTMGDHAPPLASARRRVVVAAISGRPVG